VTADLAEFLRARLDDVEQVARAATAGPWRVHDTWLNVGGHTATVLSGEGNGTDLRAWLPTWSTEPWDEKRNVWNDAEHIALHDPARVLRQVEAGRRIVDEHEHVPAAPWGSTEVTSVGCETCHDQGGDVIGKGWCATVRALALPFADHPEYRPEWAPS
jgi:hypothetical protein